MTQPVAQPRHAVARSGFANPLTLGIKVTDTSFVKVYADDMLLQLGFDYTIDGLGDPAGIEITIIDGEDAGSYVDVDTFAAVFSPLYEQGADLSAGGNFGLAFESAIDALNRQIQALDDRLRRSLTLPPTYESADQLSFPLPSAGRVLVGNATNTGFENGATLPEIETIVGLTDQIVLLTGIAPQIVEVASLDTEIVGLYAVAASIAALGPIASSIATLAPQAANIATLAPQAANIALVGGNIASVIVVANAIANVNIVATNITSVNTAAANMAAIIAAPGAATAAANSATAANNSAIAAAASAASIDVKAIDVRRNLIVNGSVAVSQENGNTLGTTNGFYFGDQIAQYFYGTGFGVSAQRVTAWTPDGSDTVGELKCTSAKASLSAGDLYVITQNIEGSNPEFKAAMWGTASAKPMVFRTARQIPAGLYHLRVANQDSSRSVAIPFTVQPGQANAMGVIGDAAGQVPPITIPPCFDGTWLRGDGQIGCTFDIVLAAGSSRIGGAAGVWNGGGYYAASTQKNFLDSTSNVARVGDIGARFDPNSTGVYGSYRVNEVDAVYRSERYYETLLANSLGQALVSAAIVAPISSVTWWFKVKKCKTPSAYGLPPGASWTAVPTTVGLTQDSVYFRVETSNFILSQTAGLPAQFVNARLS